MSLLRPLSVVLFAAALLNVLVLVLLGRYDLRLGPVHLVATYWFKPLLYLNAAFLIALALRQASQADAGRTETPLSPVAFGVIAFALLAAVYGASFGINLDHPEWTHRSFTGAATVRHLFTERQYDGYYRPLTFLSLRLDNLLFGEALWGYHLQNLALQLLNAWLVVRLAVRLGLSWVVARWAGLLFLMVPASFEAVIWPGARFDLLACGFTLVALERALAGSVWVSTLLYVAGVLSKESAYCYPLLLGSLFLLRRPLALPLDRARPVHTAMWTVIATGLLLAVRLAVYGDLGGYPDETTGGSVNFVLTPKSLTSLVTRVPAALFLVNSSADLTWWLRLAVAGFAGALAVALAAGARLGSRAALLPLAFVAAVPALNVVGWLNHSAGGGRYVYQSAVWVVLALAYALMQARRGPVVAGVLVAAMAVAALFNTLAYTTMLHGVRRTVAAAQAVCRDASCCRTVILRDLPRDFSGATFFGDQVRRDLARALPGVAVAREGQAAAGQCAVELVWSEAERRLQVR